MDCSNCGASNADDAVLCTECGAPVVQNVPAPAASAPPVAAENLVRCRACGAENAAGAVFCSACRGLLSAPPAGDEPVSSVPSNLTPRSDEAAAHRPVERPGAPLPKRCPSCGGPIYPDQARCSRCGTSVAALTALEREPLHEDSPRPAVVSACVVVFDIAAACSEGLFLLGLLFSDVRILPVSDDAYEFGLAALLVAGPALAALARGLWRLRGWARWPTVLALVAGIAGIGLVALFYPPAQSPGWLAILVLLGAVALFFIYWFVRHGEHFQRPSTGGQDLTLA